MSDVLLEQVVALALQLSVSEQARLLERVAANLAREVDIPSNETGLEWTEEELDALTEPVTPKTGAEIVAMMESGQLPTLDSIDIANPYIIDPVEWAKALRAEMAKNRNLDWGNG
jgi:hypothetical protein